MPARGSHPRESLTLESEDLGVLPPVAFPAWLHRKHVTPLARKVDIRQPEKYDLKSFGARPV